MLDMEYAIMGTCRVDDSGAGKYAQLSAGAHRFCEAHSGEDWHVRGAEAAGGLALSASFNGAPIGNGWPLIIHPTLTLDDDVFRELEKIRANCAVSPQ
jgi:hypothetical protein